MARQRVDPIFAALARRRPSLSSPHFGLSYEVLDARASGRLGFSVPKRQLSRAVDRNALKRVAREAWRHARWGSIRRPCAAMLKLRRADVQWKSTPRGALKKAWRAELDALFERLVASLRGGQCAEPNPPRKGEGGPPSTEAAPVSPKSQPNRTSP